MVTVEAKKIGARVIAAVKVGLRPGNIPYPICGSRK